MIEHTFSSTPSFREGLVSVMFGHEKRAFALSQEET
jgi:hypothetical protein